jgi:Rrf2 family transcriptional regulator, iron-sulfur cluster assembly transcription factor
MFSKACEYGIRSLILIALESKKGRCVNIAAISKEIDSPSAFTAKILQKLVKADIIVSVQGFKGGFKITETKAAETTLAKIVSVIDGPKIYRGCALGLRQCNEIKPCPLHTQFAAVRGSLKVMLESSTIESLALKLESGLGHLKV